MRLPTRTASLVTMAALGLAASSCGTPRGAVDVSGIVPRLPGDGSANTTEPTDQARGRTPAQQPAPDPWAGRTDLLAPPEAQPPRAVTLPPIERFTLPNGLSVIVIAKRDVPVIDVQLMVRAGNTDVAPDKMGLAQFVSAMLPKGTRTRDARTIARTIDTVGGALTVTPGFDATLLSCQALAEHQSTCVNMVADIVSQPTFPADEMDLVRRELQASVRQRHDDAGALAGAHFQNLLWGDAHVRGRPMSMRTLDAIERKDLVDWHRTWFVPQNATLVLAGDVDTKGLRLRLGQSFRTWTRPRAARVPQHASHAEPTLAGSRIRLVDKPGQTQTHIRVGHLGITHRDPAFFDTVVWNHVLGGGFTSRLMRVVRIEGGKAYGASTSFDRNRSRGAFVASTFTRNAEAAATTEMILTELMRMKQEGATEAEIRAAVTHLAGQYAINFQSASDIAGAILAAELHGFDDKYVRDYPLALARVTAPSAAQAAAAVLQPENLAVVLVGDAKALEPQLQARGWAYDKIGHLEPIAAVERAPAKAEPISPQAAAAGKALLAKALTAKGGEARLRAVRSMTIQATGTIRSGDQEIQAKLQRRYVAPDRLRLDLDLTIPGGSAQVITVLDRKQAWTKQPNGVVDLPAEGVAELEKQVWRDQEFILLRAKDNGVRVEALGQQTRDGVTYEALRITRPDGLSVDLFLDPKTYLVRVVSYEEAPGRLTTERLDEYRVVDGLQVAHRRITTNPEANLDVRIESVAINATIAPDVFAKPK
jgi:zinc protease